MIAKTVHAQNAVLDHHVAGNPGTLEWAQESQHAAYDPDDHLNTMQGLAGNYQAGQSQ